MDDEWKDGWMNRRMDGCWDAGWMEGWVDKGWVDRRTNDGRMGGWKDGGQLMKCFAPFSHGVFVRKVVYRPRMDAFPDLCWTLSSL